MKEGGEGQDIAKMNSQLDQPVIQKLDEASMAGVRLNRISQGHLHPAPRSRRHQRQYYRAQYCGGGQLEHSRIFWFANNGDEQLFMSSAD